MPDVIEIKDNDIFLNGDLIDKKEFGSRFQEKINYFLHRWNLHVRPMKLGDFSKLYEKDENNLDNIDKICGDDNDVLAQLFKGYLDKIRYEERHRFIKNRVKQEDIDITPIVIVKGEPPLGDVEQKIEWLEKMYCFVAEHYDKNKINEILSFSLTYMNKNNEKNGLYFDTSCTLQSHNCSKSLNYFIRVYAILEMMKNNEPINFIWGCIAGDDIDRLKKMHIGRGCEIKEKTYCRRNSSFNCDVSSFLNVFFGKMETYKWDGC